MTVCVAVAQVKSKKADYAENLNRIGSVLADVKEWDTPPDLVVFPETMMSGYNLQSGVRENAVSASKLCSDLAALFSEVGGPEVDLAVGFYEEHLNRLYNSAAYVSLSNDGAQVRHVHRKVFLPTYGMFDEKRFVGHGQSVQAFDTRWGRGALLVCEDAWHSIMGSLAAMDGAQMLLVPSAAPARGLEGSAGIGTESRPGSVDSWQRMTQRLAEESSVFVVLVQPAGFEGGKAFQGGSTIAGPGGEVIVTAPSFEETLMVADLDFDAISRARANQHNLADLEAQLPMLLQPDEPECETSSIHVSSQAGEVPEPQPGGYSVLTSGPQPDPLAIDCELAARWLEAFLRDEVVRQRSFDRVVVGLSGGVDSALSATLATRALGAESVIGVRMPYRTSSPDSLEHAKALADQLGIRLETVDISAAVDALVAAVDETADSTRRGNVMARMRMITLFDLSVKYGALPLGSGNKTERLFGYFTWHGDDSPPVNPLGDLYKTQVWALARHLGVPDEIVSKAPSADLVAGQTDEADLGVSYLVADKILHLLLSGFRPKQIAESGFDAADVERVDKRLNSTHWKRQLPSVAVVSRTAIGEAYLRPVDYGLPHQ